MTETEFFANAPKWIQDDISNWNHFTLLAYFCHKYEKKHGVRFHLVRSAKGVELSKESADFAKLFKMMAPENYAKLDKDERFEIRKQTNIRIKNFINWAFDFKFRSGAKSINGTRFFLAHNIINEFERDYNKYLAKNGKLQKWEMLITWCKQEANDVFQYHQLANMNDLEFLHNYVKQYKLDETYVEGKVIKKAEELGLING